MNLFGYALTLAAACAPVFAALPVVAGKDQAAMLKSSDPKLAANKKVAYDFFRIVLRGFRLDQADKYMTNDYMQHNPNAETGMAGFKAYFNAVMPKQLPAIPDTLPGLVAIVVACDGQDGHVDLTHLCGGRIHRVPIRIGLRMIEPLGEYGRCIAHDLRQVAERRVRSVAFVELAGPKIGIAKQMLIGRDTAGEA